MRTWWWCDGTDAVVAQQGAVVVRLVLLLPDSELLTGESLMLRGPLQNTEFVISDVTNLI